MSITLDPVSAPPPPESGRAPETLADLVARLGDIPLDRIVADPAPGTATEEDVLKRPGGEKRICELVDGVLVLKTMGYYESRVAVILIHILESYLDDHDLGIALGPDATMRLAPGLVRIPDVSFFSWRHFPNRLLPEDPQPKLAPDLAIEVLSKGNTRGEMERKLREYFAAGSSVVWYADPKKATVRVYSSPEDSVLLGEDDVLDGGELLPGLRISIRDWLKRAGRREG
jgi:Uma2 family endonuclease